MLMCFKTENYRQFATEQSLSMIATPSNFHPDHVSKCGDWRVLSTAVIFGANGSGKSNLIRAISSSREYILTGKGLNRHDHNRLSEENGSKTTGFEYTISIDGHCYAYGFEILLSDEKVQTEWMSELSAEGHTDLFFRDGDSLTTDLEPEDRMILEHCMETSNRLMIGTLSRTPLESSSPLTVSKALMGWFSKNLIVISSEELAICENTWKVINAFCPNITDVNPRQGFTRHDMTSFDITDESDDIRKLISLAPIIDRDGPDNITFVVDDLDLNLHPNTTSGFLKMFNLISSEKKRQLIAIAHDTHLLRENHLRRDEVWFVDGHPTYSEIYSLADFKESDNKDIERSYLEGRYGAISHIHKPYPGLRWT